ncbi:hypothetical protein [Sorangium sp. So ce1335]|uniref:hypothetical protein n=1 Tax=Sorangium sp. So ce1335 TaxID=3133335 RepID=UPI003F62D2AC
MTNQRYPNSVQWGFIIAKAWAEAEFKDQLETDPVRTIKQYMMEQFKVNVERVFQVPPIPENLNIEVMKSMDLEEAARLRLSDACTVCGCGASHS